MPLLSMSLKIAYNALSLRRLELCLGQVMYDRACKFWHFLYNIFQEYHLLSGRQWMMFYATEMRFFRQMLMAAKACTPLPPELQCVSQMQCCYGTKQRDLK